jgi:hypothetical protein
MIAARQPKSELVCVRCGTMFDCDPHGDCWCMHVDVVMPVPEPGTQASCLCPKCLSEVGEK